MWCRVRNNCDRACAVAVTDVGFVCCQHRRESKVVLDVKDGGAVFDVGNGDRFAVFGVGDGFIVFGVEAGSVTVGPGDGLVVVRMVSVVEGHGPENLGQPD